MIYDILIARNDATMLKFCSMLTGADYARLTCTSLLIYGVQYCACPALLTSQSSQIVVYECE